MAVNSSFVVGNGIDLGSVSFNLGNFYSSREHLQSKVKKLIGSRGWKLTSLPSINSPIAELENFAFSL